MKLNSLQLEAFFHTAQTRSFSKAAKRLSITQSALSQRVSNLEKDLEVTLFVRDPKDISLTQSGEKLLRFCQSTNSWEEEILEDLRSSSQELRGTIRIAAFSSVLRSVIIPSLSAFLRANPKVRGEFRSYEVVNLYEVLKNAEADLVILDYRLSRPGIVEHVLGREEYVVVESAKFQCPSTTYLDHGPHDNATDSFFQFQSPKSKQNYERNFMGDVYGIIGGVELGLGRAVMSKHMIQNNPRVRILPSPKRYFRDVTLHYFEQPYYSKLHLAVRDQLLQRVAAFLNPDR